MQGKDAQRIEHATVSGAASAVPSAGGGVCAALYGEYMRGDSVGACVERLIAADDAAAAGDVGNGAIPLAAQHARAFVRPTCDAAAVFVAGACVFQAGGCVEHAGYVAVVPVCGGRAGQHAPEHGASCCWP